MILNPFTPSEIAANPEDFFGRSSELKILERSLQLGSVAIQGAIGIGKSSLLTRVRLLMEGFNSSHSGVSVYATAHKDIKSIDDAARLLVESFADVDERSFKIKFNLGKVIELESLELTRHFVEKRHLAILIKILEQQYLDILLKDKEIFIIAIDEIDKAPHPFARLIRSLQTHLQQNGIRLVKFCIAGVYPYFQKMLDEDQGISRFFYKNIMLLPMKNDEAIELLSYKLDKFSKDVFSESGKSVTIDFQTVERMAALSGGHPHILQLLGSHVVENELENPDYIIDLRDLIDSLRTICFEKRAYVYNSSIHLLEINNKLTIFSSLLDLAREGYPTRIDQSEALGVATPEDLHWLVENNYFVSLSDNDYGLVDEFIRIRLVFDESSTESAQLERRMLETEAINVPKMVIGTEDDFNREDNISDAFYRDYSWYLDEED